MMNTYVYANFNNSADPDKALAWEMTLEELFGDIRMDDSEYAPIEFKTSEANEYWIEKLIDDRCEIIFRGTLEEFHEAVAHKAL